MISVQDAEALILANIKYIKNEKVSIQESYGKILDENLYADRDFPPFDRITMDGIAFNFDGTQGKENQRKTFIIEATIAAGSPQIALKNNQNCIEVMTGAILPEGCDTVVKYEDFEQQDRLITLKIDAIQKGQNVHNQGSDRKKGDLIMPIGKIISAAEIGVMATIGASEVLVKCKPKIIIISTGDELVEIHQKPLQHQIRSSNGHAIQAALIANGADAECHHLSDNQALIESRITHFLTIADAIVITGGVSAGKFDFVPTALKNQGVRQIFHQVAQRPGKPLWFGVSETGVAVFALPGNPVSTFMCLHRYVLLWLKISQGVSIDTNFAILNEDVQFLPPLTLFLQVKIENKNGIQTAIPIAGNGSGDLANLIDADGFLELPAMQNSFQKGQAFRYFKFR